MSDVIEDMQEIKDIYQKLKKAKASFLTSHEDLLDGFVLKNKQSVAMKIYVLPVLRNIRSRKSAKHYFTIEQATTLLGCLEKDEEVYNASCTCFKSDFISRCREWSKLLVNYLKLKQDYRNKLKSYKSNVYKVKEKKMSNGVFIDLSKLDEYINWRQLQWDLLKNPRHNSLKYECMKKEAPYFTTIPLAYSSHGARLHNSGTFAYGYNHDDYYSGPPAYKVGALLLTPGDVKILEEETRNRLKHYIEYFLNKSDPVHVDLKHDGTSSKLSSSKRIGKWNLVELADREKGRKHTRARMTVVSRHFTESSVLLPLPECFALPYCIFKDRPVEVDLPSNNNQDRVLEAYVCQYATGASFEGLRQSSLGEVALIETEFEQAVADEFRAQLTSPLERSYKDFLPLCLKNVPGTNKFIYMVCGKTINAALAKARKNEGVYGTYKRYIPIRRRVSKVLEIKFTEDVEKGMKLLRDLRDGVYTTSGMNAEELFQLTNAINNDIQHYMENEVTEDTGGVVRCL
jgi:hypothetical protein